MNSKSNGGVLKYTARSKDNSGFTSVARVLHPNLLEVEKQNRAPQNPGRWLQSLRPSESEWRSLFPVLCEFQLEHRPFPRPNSAEGMPCTRAHALHPSAPLRQLHSAASGTFRRGRRARRNDFRGAPKAAERSVGRSFRLRVLLAGPVSPRVEVCEAQRWGRPSG